MITLNNFLEQNNRVTFSGVVEGVDADILVKIAHQSKRILHIASNDAKIAAIEQLIHFFDKSVRVVTFPAWDCLPYDRVSPNVNIVTRRLEVLSEFASSSSDSDPQPTIILTSVNAVLRKVLPRSSIQQRFKTIKVGETLNLESILSYLTINGFNRVEIVIDPGDFAVRGGLIDIYAPSMEFPARVDLFGNDVEQIRLFDPESQRTINKVVDLIKIIPANEVCFDDHSINLFRSSYRQTFPSAVVTSDPLYESISQKRKYIGMEHWQALFYESMETLFDYFPDIPITFDHHIDGQLETAWETIEDHYNNRKEIIKSKAKGGQALYHPLPPHKNYILKDDFYSLIGERPVGVFSSFIQSDSAEVVPVNAHCGRCFVSERTVKDDNVFDVVVAYIKEQSSKNIVIACVSLGTRERISNLLHDHGLTDIQPINTYEEIPKFPTQRLFITVLPLSAGYHYDNTIFISEQDIVGDRLSRPRRKTRRAENYLREVSSIMPQDYVIHFEHGIGRFDGLVSLSVGNAAPHECLALTYADNDRLYVPVENIEVLSRYGSADMEVHLDKLGGLGWQTRCAKLKKRLKDMAEDLIKISAEREVKRVEPLGAPEVMYQEFCARFPYDETEDQLTAIEEAVSDLSCGRPMDRLICGDVGFGKTEVALRIAFQVVMSNKQVAVIAPTTLLARQHLRTFTERFKDLPVNICQLSRMVSTKQSAINRKDLKEGLVDIIIGTHALLAKSISFKRLGLLVIDEEQSFGVKHKERLKQLKLDVHVLTLSATPIPRTMQLALTGVKDLSLITTPPVDRLAVRTFCMPFDPVIIREALMREHMRGGQSFYVCPRIKDLEGIKKNIHALAPDLTICVVHGRMPTHELEEKMNAFYEHKYDILVSTNIIESGLDIPTANTLIVHNANMFGLSNLYQLRGRIGRSKLRAYAYLTTPENGYVNMVAEKRLNVLQKLDNLGSGFTLASHDLDLRGSGNILGEEQSGHIREVGFELYQSMLKEAIAKVRLQQNTSKDANQDQEIFVVPWSPQINIGIAVMLPETYIKDLGLRISIYRRLADAENQDDLAALKVEMVDRFGQLPKEAESLFHLFNIKKLCAKANIEKMDVGAKGIVIQFRNREFPNPDALIEYITKRTPEITIRPDQKVSINKSISDQPQKRIKIVQQVLQDIVALVG